MRITRILLVLIFLAVLVLYTIQDLTGANAAADVPPVLSCDSETLEISVNDDDSVLLTGITATDAQDGDLTGRVLVSGVSRLIGDSTAKVSYAVFDSDNNMATLTRYIRYTDYRLPRFSLDAPLIYRSGEEVKLLDRLHADDSIDGDITDAIRVTYTDTAGETGIHRMNVQVTNSMGDTAWLTLPVIILDGEQEYVDVTLHTYLVYLEQGSRFSPSGYLESASLNGASISLGNVTTSGEVDTDTPGIYNVAYTCVYGSRSGTAVLTVVVE